MPLNNPPLARRLTFAKVSASYANILADTIRHTKINDGTTGEDGEILVRDLYAQERHPVAVLLAMQFFVSLMRLRAEFEPKPEGLISLDMGLHGFAARTLLHAQLWHEQQLNKFPISIEPAGKQLLTEHESNYANIIFQGLRSEMNAPVPPHEPTFWREVFLGFGDGDPSGRTVGLAARKTLLDYPVELENAFAYEFTKGDTVTRH